jgi:thymidylate kinase
VALEGISGSGKTAQTELLAHALRTIPSVTNVRIIDEFSSSPLGEFIRIRLGMAEDFRIHILEGSSYLNSLLVMADMVNRIHTASICAPGTICIFDGFCISQIAHTLALLPNDSGPQLRGNVALAAEILCQQLALLPGPVFTVLLDVPPEVAYERLRERLGKPLDNEQQCFLMNLRNAFNELATGGNISARIDATQPIETVTQKIMEILSPSLSQIYVESKRVSNSDTCSGRTQRCTAHSYCTCPPCSSGAS